MSLPLYKSAGEQQPTRGAGGHAGLWYDKFCDRWRIDRDGASLKGDDGNNSKLDWICTLTAGKIGDADQMKESASRIVRLIDRQRGRWDVFATAWRFVTGLGRSHPVENGFAWHPTLGTPYLPGSSIKGLVRAWAERDADPKPDCATTERLLGSRDRKGAICFLDAIPVQPVQLDADVMTPHYAGWTRCDPPGDWRSPTPIPFLVTAAGTPFLFGFVGRRPVAGDDLTTISGWLNEALAWAGGGAKTAVGYGRFDKDDGKTDELKRRLREADRAQEQRLREKQEAEKQARRLESLSPIEREIEDILDNRKDKSTPDTVAIMHEVEQGRWAGEAKLEVAQRLRERMRKDKKWKEQSGAKNPAKDRDHQRTLRVKKWLGEE